MYRKVLLALASLTLATVMAETGLRALNLFPPPPAMPVPRFPELYWPDSGLGYTLWPSRHTTYRYPLRSQRQLSVVSNASGFRNREFDEPDSRPRVWMFGDSFVFGDGVEAADRLTEVIERIEPRWRIDNMGMTGWGLDLMVRAFERFSSRLKPDLVVLAFYTDDFHRLGPRFAGQGYPLRRFELVGGRLEDRPYPPLSPWRQFRLVRAVGAVEYQFTRDRLDLHEALLNRLQKNRSNVPIVVVFLPGRADTDEDKSHRRFLEKWCRDAAVPFLDLTDVIHRGGAAVFIPGNPHWNEKGHALAGTAIHAFLRDSGRLH